MTIPRPHAMPLHAWFARAWLAAVGLVLLLAAMTPAFAQRDAGQYQILEARYGTAERNVDVTRRLQELARADRPFRMNNDTFGVDPDEGRVKTLRIYARGPDGRNRVFEYREGSVIDGAQFTGWRAGDWGRGGWNGGWGGPGDGADAGPYRIVQALYGTAERHVDVTGRLRELARADRPFRMNNDTFGVDPDEGRVKALRIYARGPRGESRMFEYREGSVVDGAQFSGWRGGDWGGGDGGGWEPGGPPPPPRIAIVRAIYGAGDRAYDVTERLRSMMARDGRIDLVVDNDSMGGDPAERMAKMLWVTYDDGRGEKQVQIYENGRLRLP